MSEIKDLLTVNDYSSKFSLSPLHPLVTVHDLSKGSFNSDESAEAVRYHFYGIFLKQGEACIMRYGRKQYDTRMGHWYLWRLGKWFMSDTSIRILNHPDMPSCFTRICLEAPTWAKV